MQRTYPAIIDREGTLYGISFPDFPGCVSSANSPEAVIASGTEALTGHIAVSAEYGDPIPDPTPLEQVDTTDPEANIVCVTLITVAVPGRMVRYNVSLDESLVAEIDRVAGKGNRSAFLADAARDKLAHQRRA